MTDNKPKQESTAAEVRRGQKSRTVSERGRVSKRTCWSKLGRNFANSYIIGTGAGAVYMASTSLPGDMAIHGAWTAGTTALAAFLIVWWLEMRKRE